MLRNCLLRIAASIAVAVGVSASAFAAAIVSNSPVPSGPGGSGASWSVASFSGNNEDSTSFSFNQLSNSGITFTSFGSIDTEFSVTSSGGVHDYEVFEASITNSTGGDWFSYSLSLPSGITGLNFDTPDGGGAGERTPTPRFTNETTGDSVAAFVHGTDSLVFDLAGFGLLDGQVASIAFSIDVPDLAGGSFTLGQAPVIPEPGVDLLFASGALLLALGLRRQPR